MGIARKLCVGAIGAALWLGGCTHSVAPTPSAFKLSDVRELPDGLVIPIKQDWLKLRVAGDAIIHVQFAHALTPFDQPSLAVLPSTDPQRFTWRISGPQELTLATTQLRARVNLDTGGVTFLDPAGNTLLAERSRQLTPATVQGASTDHVRQQWTDVPGRRWFGLGENQLGLTDVAGYDLDLWQHNGTIVVPMLVSDSGCGILWDNPSYSRFGDLRLMQPIPPEDLVDSAFKATYFSGDDATGAPLLIRQEPTINVDERPLVNQRTNPDLHQTPLDATNLSHGVARWEGTVIAPTTGDYQFQSFFNGSFRVWIDGQMVTDHWRQNWLPWYDLARVNWVAGSKHAVQAEWDRQQGQVAQLRWKPPLPAGELVAHGINPAGPPPLSLWSQVGEKVDYFFIYGGSQPAAAVGDPTAADRVIAGYRKLTGVAPMMPKWAFGLWQSRQRYETAQQALDAVNGFRDRKIPFDNIVEDWQYWPRDAWGCQDFDPVRFPDPTGWIKAIHAQHSHLMISVWAKFYASTKNYAEMKRRGFLYPNIERDHFIDWIGYAYSFFDAFNPAARDLMWSMVKPGLFDRGVDGWWLDATEPDLLTDPTLRGQMDYVTPTALGPGTRVLNAFAPQMAKTFYEHQRQDAPDQRVFILTRSGYTGQQKYAASSWSGDSTSTWTAMKKQIAAGVGFCMSGLPYWTMDIGGFSVPERFGAKPPTDANTDEWREMNTRWFQFGAFVPLLRVHGEYPYREMWQFGGETSPAYAAMLKVDRVRYHLLPYIYGLSADVTTNGGTMMRGLGMDFPADHTATGITDQYLFGPALMVSPVTTYQARSRSVYLPGGESWYDFWTGKPLTGGQSIQADAPYDQIPVHVRAGAIVPTGPDQQYVDEQPNGPLTIWVYTGADGSFNLYDDDGVTYGYERGQSAIIPLHWDDAGHKLIIGGRRGSYPGMAASRTINVVFVSPDKSVPFALDPAVDQTVQYTGAPITITR